MVSENHRYLKVRVNWSCGQGYFNQSFHTSWDDGTHSTYNCWSNCGSGTYYVDHTYSTSYCGVTYLWIDSILYGYGGQQNAYGFYFNVVC